MHVCWSYGPKMKNHFLSIFQAKCEDFGEEEVPFLFELADQLFEQLNFDYGFVCSEEEYAATNIYQDVQINSTTVQPVKVVGMQFPDCIPGIYWGNYFGDIYFQQGFDNRIEELEIVHRLSNGVRLITSKSISSWNDSDAIARREKSSEILGMDWFFFESERNARKTLGDRSKSV